MVEFRLNAINRQVFLLFPALCNVIKFTFCIQALLFVEISWLLDVNNYLNFFTHGKVKILVPNSTAGMIIGKGGSFIKEIKNKTGAFIQVSQKSREMSLAERCITVGGNLLRNVIS